MTHPTSNGGVDGGLESIRCQSGGSPSATAKSDKQEGL